MCPRNFFIGDVLSPPDTEYESKALLIEYVFWMGTERKKFLL